MSDIIFKCWKCSKSLAIDVQAAEKLVPCPDCGTHLTVPPPSFDFSCLTCGQIFGSSEEYRGIRASCPSCDSDLAVFDKRERPASEPTPPIADQ